MSRFDFRKLGDLQKLFVKAQVETDANDDGLVLTVHGGRRFDGFTVTVTGENLVDENGHLSRTAKIEHIKVQGGDAVYMDKDFADLEGAMLIKKAKLHNINQYDDDADGDEDEPGDDKGNDGVEDEPGDDKGNDGVEDEPGDDKGNDGVEGETGDDKGGLVKKWHDRIDDGDDGRVLHGGKGNDKIWGNGGDDDIWGDKGNDKTYGGEGADKFHFGPKSGNDCIFDFEDGKDMIDLSDLGLSFDDLRIRDRGDDVRIDGEFGRITLKNFDGDITVDDFIGLQPSQSGYDI
jgi:Ca2+-binding RTX toxin-like protein